MLHRELEVLKAVHYYHYGPTFESGDSKVVFEVGNVGRFRIFLGNLPFFEFHSQHSLTLSINIHFLEDCKNCVSAFQF